MPELCVYCETFARARGSVYCGPCRRRAPTDARALPIVAGAMSAQLELLEQAVHDGNTRQALKILHHLKANRDLVETFSEHLAKYPLRHCPHCSRAYSAEELALLPEQHTTRAKLRICLCGASILIATVSQTEGPHP
jgi:hypothetical protein